MGRDAGIFAKNAKKFFWFDRAKNIEGHLYDEASLTQEERDIGQKIYSRALNPDSWNYHVSAQEILRLVDFSRRARYSSDPEYPEEALESPCSEYYLNKIESFISKFPNDLFSIKTDHGGEWPECCDIYSEVFASQL